MAVKIIKAYPLSENKEYLSYTYKCVRQEINKLLYLKPHPQIAQVLGVLCNPYGLVLELAPVGDLQSSVIDNYRYTNNLLCSTAILLTLKQVIIHCRLVTCILSPLSCRFHLLLLISMSIELFIEM